MTRDEYFLIIKNNIQSLSIEEQNEALQYYSDYFDDCGDDEKAMQELGDAENLAKEITQKFSNALVKTKKEEQQEDSTQNTQSSSNALYYEFSKTQVKNVEFSFGAAQVVLVSGTKYCIETRGITSSSLECRVDSKGTLIVKNLRNFSQFKFWEHSNSSRIVPRILITIPENAQITNFALRIGAGKLTTKGVNLNYEKAFIEVGAGNMELEHIQGNSSTIRCGMGSLKIVGKLSGRNNIDCGMGAIKMELSLPFEQYSYDAKIGLGSFKFNDVTKNGVSQVCCNAEKENHISVNVGLGSVLINAK